MINYNIPECIYSKQFGGHRFKRIFCCHVWRNEATLEERNGVIIEKNECVECGRSEIMILVRWRWPFEKKDNPIAITE